MSVQENKGLVQRFFDEVVNQYRLEVLDEIVGTDVYIVKDGRIQSVVRTGPDLRAMLAGES